MKLQTILEAAKQSMIVGKRKPHCCEATGEQLERRVQSEIEEMQLAPGYAEPGYRDPKRAVVFANWNCFPRNFDRVLERAGYAVEWSDEWATCCDCGKAVRTSPDSYFFTSYYRVMNDCELVCLDCLDAADYLESIEDDARSAVPPQAKFHPEKHGYVKHNGDFETGFHAHMTDDPKKILAALHAAGHKRVVFRIAENSQFYTTWEAYYKLPESE